MNDLLDSIEKPIPFKPRFRSFEEGEEIQIRFLKEPTYTQNIHWKSAECQICKDFPELSRKSRQVPGYTADQIPGHGMPAYLMTVLDNSPLYNAKYLIIKGVPNE
ncbi:MAG: hypothetical protein WC358_08560 [Ignavibacteria bacterium]